MAVDLWRRPARLAHRMFRHVQSGGGRAHRYSRWRLGPPVPASRKRDRAERGRAGSCLCQYLDARRVPQFRQRENVEVAGKFFHRARGAEQTQRGARRRGSAVFSAARPLPQRDQLHLRNADGCGQLVDGHLSRAERRAADRGRAGLEQSVRGAVQGGDGR